MKEIKGGDLGVVDCDYVARGEDAKAVVEDMVAHLEEEHDIDMPDPEVILDPDRKEGVLTKIADALAGGRDRGTELLIQRLRTALDIKTEDGTRTGS